MSLTVLLCVGCLGSDSGGQWQLLAGPGPTVPRLWRSEGGGGGERGWGWGGRIDRPVIKSGALAELSEAHCSAAAVYPLPYALFKGTGLPLQKKKRGPHSGLPLLFVLFC